MDTDRVMTKPSLGILIPAGRSQGLLRLITSPYPKDRTQ